ncbi:hypothetical protein EON63_01510 [archaeon]|nr:MAG: hypothetical protein EON63_01510 [archaeon]
MKILSAFLIWAVVMLGAYASNSSSHENHTDIIQKYRMPTSLETASWTTKPHYFCLMTKIKVLSHIHTCNIVEWVVYHYLMGVDHIYIADDQSSENSLVADTLQYFIDINYISLLRVNDKRQFATQNEITRFLFRHFASKQCEWVGNIDVDEFLTFRTNKPEDTDLKVYLSEIRDIGRILPWWMMSNEGHIARPKGFITENYFHGWNYPGHLKSISRASEIREWSYQLHPFYLANKKRATIHGENQVKFLQRSSLREEEETEIIFPQEGGKVRVFTSNFYIQHYRYLSFQEFSLQKGLLNRTAGGLENPWARAPYKTWLRGNNSVARMTGTYTAFMAQKVRAGLYLLKDSDEVAVALKDCFVLWDR